MSWWVYLEDRTAEPWCSYNQNKPWEPDFEGDERCTVPCYPSVVVEPFSEGGTYVLGGSTVAELNITYNYSKLYYMALESRKGLRALHDQRAGDMIEHLECAVEMLCTGMASRPSKDYWEPTPGNAGRALKLLLSWARQYPDAYFRVS